MVFRETDNEPIGRETTSELATEVPERLAPCVIDAVLSGESNGVTLESWLRQSLPVDWREQEALLDSLSPINSASPSSFQRVPT